MDTLTVPKKLAPNSRSGGDDLAGLLTTRSSGMRTLAPQGFGLRRVTVTTATPTEKTEDEKAKAARLLASFMKTDATPTSVAGGDSTNDAPVTPLHENSCNRCAGFIASNISYAIPAALLSIEEVNVKESSGDDMLGLIADVSTLSLEVFGEACTLQVSKKSGWRLFILTTVMPKPVVAKAPRKAVMQQCCSCERRPMLGFLTYRIKGAMRMMEIGKAAVPSSLRGKGYGKKLVKHVQTLAKANLQCDCVALSSLKEAVSFYQKLGFKKCGQMDEIEEQKEERRRTSVTSIATSLSLLVPLTDLSRSTSAGCSTTLSSSTPSVKSGSRSPKGSGKAKADDEDDDYFIESSSPINRTISVITAEPDDSSMSAKQSTVAFEDEGSVCPTPRSCATSAIDTRGRSLTVSVCGTEDGDSIKYIPGQVYMEFSCGGKTRRRQAQKGVKLR